MPPRHAFWTIIYGGQPTSFRSATRDELVPTFKQIQSRHPDAQLRYFARGKLWYSDEEAQAALVRERHEKRERRRPDRRRREEGPGSPERRSRENGLGSAKPRSGGYGLGPPKPRSDWRPGGEHKDPRARFKVPRDVKRARFKAKLRRDRTDQRDPRGPGDSRRPGDSRGPRDARGRRPPMGGRPPKKRDDE